MYKLHCCKILVHFQKKKINMQTIENIHFGLQRRGAKYKKQKKAMKRLEHVSPALQASTLPAEVQHDEVRFSNKVCKS
jgi:ribosomal protein L32